MLTFTYCALRVASLNIELEALSIYRPKRGACLNMCTHWQGAGVLHLKLYTHGAIALRQHRLHGKHCRLFHESHHGRSGVNTELTRAHGQGC